MTVSRSANSLFNAPKAAISVGQTKVKSLGQKKITFHLPASLASVRRVNAVFGSFEMTACRLNAGSFVPIVNMFQFAPERVCWREMDGFGRPRSDDACSGVASKTVAAAWITAAILMTDWMAGVLIPC